MIWKARLWLILFICVLVLAPFLVPSPYSDPVHVQPLSHWLAKLGRDSTREEQSAAREAIWALGDQAVPQLVFWIGAKESQLSKLALKVEALLGIDLPVTPVAVRHERAIAAFHILGSRADNAIPALASLARDPRTALPATRALTSLGAGALEPLLVALENGPPEARTIAALDLGYRAIPDGRSVQSLIDALQDEDAKVRWTAAHALARFPGAADLVVPALVSALSDPDQSVRGRAISSLGDLGTNAEPALPALIALSQKHPELIWFLSGAVTRISPRVAEEHGLLSSARLVSYE